MTKRYKSHPISLELKVALEAATSQKTVNQIASEHQVLPSQVTEWKQLLLREGEIFFQNKRQQQKRMKILNIYNSK